jgi:hypothetical protein
VADHHLLAQLANKTKGELIYPDSVSNLTSILTSNDELKPLYYRILNTRNAIHLKSLFFLILSLLVLEWGLRRYLGTY